MCLAMLSLQAEQKSTGRLMTERVLRDHSEPCKDLGRFKEANGVWGCDGYGCPGGREVTAAEIQEMAYSLWQAEQMDEYHRDVL